MAINIPFVADVARWLRGTRSVEDSIEDVGDSLDDLARDTRRSSERAAEDIEDSYRDALREVSQASRRAGDDVGDNLRRGADAASDGLDNMRDEAGGTAREVAASFDGSAESIAGGFQEVAANALAGFGPIGGAAGLALAAGMGVFWNQWQENAEKTKQVVSDMYDDLIESGEDYLSESYRQEQYWQILKGESDVIERARVDQIAAYSKTSSEEVALAYAGDVEAMQRVTDGLIEKRKVFQAQLEDETTTNDAAATSGRKYIDEMIAANERRTESIIKTTDEVIRQRDYFDQMGTSAVTSAEEARAKFDGLGRQISGLPDTKTVRVTVDRRDVDAYVRSIENQTVRLRVQAQVTGQRVV